jgi:hypothetical protein
MMGLAVLRAGIRRDQCLLLLTGCVTVGVVGLGPVAAHAATPPSLTGETLTSHVPPDNGSLTGACTGNGEEGSLNFSLSGTASGPFPGTFSESGSFAGTEKGAATEFSSRFTITSASDKVTGFKLLVGDKSKAECALLSNGVGLVFSEINAVYAATINNAQADVGTATVRVSGSTGLPPVFKETFTSASVGGPPPTTPTSKRQCKHGGWKNFGGLFKNQGQCVSFVAEQQA